MAVSALAPGSFAAMAAALPDLNLALPRTTSTKVSVGEISYWSVEHHNSQVLNLILGRTMPKGLEYNDKFAEAAVKSGDLAQFALFNGINVSGICTRKEKQTREGTPVPPPPAVAPKDEQSRQKSAGPCRLRIVALGVLAQYRRLGLGSALLRHAEHAVRSDKDVLEIYARIPGLQQEKDSDEEQRRRREELLDFFRSGGYDVLHPGELTGDYPGNNSEYVVRKLTST